MPRKSDRAPQDALAPAYRLEDVDTYRVLSVIPLMTYHIVADIGCGPGYFAIPIGKIVYDGKVYAIDTHQEMLDATKQQLERIHLTNVELRLFDGKKLPLEADSVDGAFAAFVLHQAGNPKGLLGEVARCLRQGGWLALLEEGIDEPKLTEMAQDAGFRLTARHSLNNKQYMLLMRK